LSWGKITPEKLSEIYSKEENTAQFKDWETIYNSKKPILFADISKDSGLNIDAPQLIYGANGRLISLRRVILKIR
jgi:hypothetical protein